MREGADYPIVPNPSFLSIPSVTTSVLEQHPFSLLNIPSEDDTAIFLVRVHAGATQKLCDALVNSTAADIPVYLEGPYGTVHHFDIYSTVLLFAGG
jgi:NAD(P)H-flavin reductase